MIGVEAATVRKDIRWHDSGTNEMDDDYSPLTPFCPSDTLTRIAKTCVMRNVCYAKRVLCELNHVITGVIGVYLSILYLSRRQCVCLRA